MFIVHANGHPVTIKTNRGLYFVAFASIADGQAFLRWQQVPWMLGTLDEILRLNPAAFPREFSALYLPTRQAIEMFAADPKGFPTDEYLVKLKHEVMLPSTHSKQASPPPKDDAQNEFRF
jgi:hypothetical protein